jgi:hypothetical protein
MKVILTWLFILSGTIFFQEKISLDALLRNPFDLHKFKKAKGPSNSGGADLRYYYFKPDEDGVYFRFFLFTKKMGYVYDSREHKRHPVRPGTGLQIITYKPKGKYFEDYFDSNETLIEVSASYNDEDLPELAFVGLDTLIIKQKLGLEFIRKDSCFIYAKENNVLVLRVAEGVVKCLKYTRLNVKVTEAALPQGLTEINCSNQPVR